MDPKLFKIVCVLLILSLHPSARATEQKLNLRFQVLASETGVPERLQFFVLFSEIPARAQPVHVYEAKGKVYSRANGVMREVGQLALKQDIDYYSQKTPGVLGVIELANLGTGTQQLHAELSNRDGWKIQTEPLEVDPTELRRASRAGPVNGWVKDLPKLPRAPLCKGLIHNTLSATGCPSGTKPTSWVEGLKCPCICCEKP